MIKIKFFWPTRHSIGILEFDFERKFGAPFLLSNSHSYTASENVIVAPQDGKFQTLCQSYHRGQGNFFHVMVVDHHGKGKFFPFSLWTFISLFYLDICFIFLFSLLYSFLFYCGHILDLIQILYQNKKLHNLNDSINIRYKEMHLYPIHRDVSFCNVM